jgi:hypothetical protein
MADASVQLVIEAWVQREWMLAQSGQQFTDLRYPGLRAINLLLSMG